MPTSLEDQVRLIAKDLGFEDCRFARAKRASHAEEFQEWLDEGKQGDMKWMENNPERRKDPSLLFDGAKTVVVLAVNYFPKESSKLDKKGVGKFAKYAWGDD
ncbi:MAG: QueG-associated DUF1730 domain-containing protein, partial [Verrucomicrobiota bacterium]|nr:QueG-associated DUF1730 domain-containing protein [Verrucomicrobiota bacterium]